MNRAKIGDIWVYNKSWHYLVIEECAAPYDDLVRAIRLEDDVQTTINPNALHDSHMWVLGV